jgi:hypothetical protein
MATIRLPPDFKEFLQLLNTHNVDNKRMSGRLKDLNDLQNLPD